jgi:diaminopimelate decarboxylase
MERRTQSPNAASPDDQGEDATGDVQRSRTGSRRHQEHAMGTATTLEHIVGWNGSTRNGRAHRTAAQDDLLIEQVARQVGTPCYIYFERKIRENLARFKDIPYPHTAVHFATMANDNPHLLGTVREAGYGVFVNSLKHLDLALKCGFGVSDVIFASTGISPALMKRLLSIKIQVNLDSLKQVELFGKVAPGSAAGIRLNIDEKSKNDPHNGLGSRIGVLESEFDVVKQAAAAAGIRFVGTHIYPGTNISRLDDSLASVEKTLALSEHFPDLEFIDLGGGFPIDHAQFDIATYKTEVARMLTRYSLHRGRPIRLVIEPGRSIFGDTAVFCTSVTDVKERPDRVVVGCDGSATLLPRAMFYEDYNPVRVAGAEGRNLFGLPVDVAGATTYSRDYLTRNVSLPEVKPADLLIFGNAGSYCYSMITRFLGQSLPPEYLLTTDGHLEEIRPGEEFCTETI